jgi:hypothetical protein
MTGASFGRLNAIPSYGEIVTVKSVFIKINLEQMRETGLMDNGR